MVPAADRRRVRRVADFCQRQPRRHRGDQRFVSRLYSNRHGLLPIVALKTRSYKHKTYGRIETPDFTICGWDGGEPTTKTAPAMQKIPSKADADNADMGYDEIPNDDMPFDR
jgi:hypothetical protein